MAVYVDKSEYTFKNMSMCHMIADTPQELHEMADKIGVNRNWFQEKSSFPHYDICKSKRALALRNGAIEVDRKELVSKMKEIRKLNSFN